MEMVSDKPARMTRRGVRARVVGTLGVAMLVATGVASAQAGGGMDTSAIEAAITAAAAAIGVIGAAVVGGPVIVKATWKWIRSAV